MADDMDDKGVIILLLSIAAISLFIFLFAREYLSRALLDATMEVLESGQNLFLEGNF